MEQTKNQSSKSDNQDYNIKYSDEYTDSISIVFEEENDSVPVNRTPNIRYVYLSKDESIEIERVCSKDSNLNLCMTKKKLNFVNLEFDTDNVNNERQNLDIFNELKESQAAECKEQLGVIISPEIFFKLPSRNLISREFLGLRVLETKKISSPSFSYYQEVNPQKHIINFNCSQETNNFSTDYRENCEGNKHLFREYYSQAVRPPSTMIISPRNKDICNLNIFQNNNFGVPREIRTRRFSTTEEAFISSIAENQVEREISLTECITEAAFARLQGNFSKLLRRQNYCKILQRSLERTCPKVLGGILDEIGKQFQSLLSDQYGNYFFPKFYGKLNLFQKLIFLQYLRDANPSEIARNQQGSYCLQKIVESVNTKEEAVVISEIFQDKVMELFNDSFGVRVLEKIISSFGEQNKNYFDIILKNFVMFACNGAGLSLVKTFFVSSQTIHSLAKIECVILQNLMILVEHHYGNYAVQVAVEKLDQNFSKAVYYSMMHNLHYYSDNKSSSRVIELCFKKGDESIVNHFVSYCAMTFRTFEMMIGRYSNYVIQSALKYGNRYSRMALANLMLNQVDNIIEKGLREKWKSIINRSLDFRMTI